ncbi:hypothetical protein Ga0100230_000625 [Opitutaceae bacterium TAV3]|nr:hypothetical protein Ga0100230_000625 [Opitutaceae bacterium TAV3]
MKNPKILITPKSKNPHQMEITKKRVRRAAVGVIAALALPLVVPNVFAQGTDDYIAASEWIEGEFAGIAELMCSAWMKPSPYMSGWTYCKDWPLYVERDDNDKKFEKFARQNVRDLQAAGINVVKWSTFPWDEGADFPLFRQYDQLFREAGMKFFIQTDKLTDIDKMAGHLERLYQFTASPAYLKIKGKPALVDFAAHTLPDATWTTIFGKLREKGIDYFYVRSIPPEAGNVEPFSPEFDRIMQKTMAVGWSGIQEFTPKTWEGHTRVEYITEMMKYCARNDWKFYPAATHNLWRTEWGGYWRVRTLTVNFRNGLENIKKTGSRSFHITTWNDFPEGQYIAPSMYKGEIMLALANYYNVVASGNTYASDQGVYLVQEQAVELGQEAKFELISFPGDNSTKARSYVEGVVLDDKDRVVYHIEKTPTNNTELLVKEFTVPTLPADGSRNHFLRPLIWSYDEGETVPAIDYKNAVSTARPIQIKAAANKNYIFSSAKVRPWSELATSTSALSATDETIAGEIKSQTPMREIRLMQNDNQIVANPGISQNIPLRFEVLVQAAKVTPQCSLSLERGRVTKALRDQPRWTKATITSGISITDGKLTWKTRASNTNNGAERLAIEADATPDDSVTLSCQGISHTVTLRTLLEQDIATFEFVPDRVALSIRITARGNEMMLFEQLPAPQKAVAFRYNRPPVAQFGADMWYLEYETENGVRFHTKPVMLFPKGESTEPQNVLVYDEAQKQLRTARIAASEAMLASLVTPQAADSLVLPNTAYFREPYNYGWPAIVGKWSAVYHWLNKNGSEPKIKDGASWFNGDKDIYLLTSRIVPSGPFTLSLDIRPEQTGTVQTVFSSPHLVLQITPEGALAAKINSKTDALNLDVADKTILTTRETVLFGKWNRIGVRLTGTALELSLDDRPAGSTALDDYKYRFFNNEFPPVLGALRVNRWGNQTKEHYKGGLRNFRLGLLPGPEKP